MAGKGSKRRPENSKAFNENWDKIFNKGNKDLNYESDNPIERPYEPVHPAETRYPHLRRK